MKVLVLGTNQLNFIYLLCKSIRRASPDISFDCLELVPFAGSKPDDFNQVFDRIISGRVAIFQFLISAGQSLFNVMFWRIFSYIVFVELKWMKALHFCYSWNREMAFLRKVDLGSYDAFHFHYIQYSYIKPIWFLPAGSNIVCTFWGSDLLRTNDGLNKFMTREALKKARVITTQSQQLGDIIESKFGPGLKHKIRILKLTADMAIFEHIDSLASEGRQNINALFGLEPSRKAVVVGHNASPFNNHIAILTALKKLSRPQDVTAIVPFTYAKAADGGEYRQKMADLMWDSPVRLRFLENYMSVRDVAALRLLTDVMVHIPATDALSGAVMETLYAGNVVVTGSWLPYGPFRDAGLHFAEVASTEDLVPCLEKVLSNLDNERKRNSDNKASVAKHFFPSATVPGWITMFKELSLTKFAGSRR